MEWNESTNYSVTLLIISRMVNKNMSNLISVIQNVEKFVTYPKVSDFSRFND